MSEAGGGSVIDSTGAAAPAGVVKRRDDRRRGTRQDKRYNGLPSLFRALLSESPFFEPCRAGWKGRGAVGSVVFKRAFRGVQRCRGEMKDQVLIMEGRRKNKSTIRLKYSVEGGRRRQIAQVERWEEDVVNAAVRKQKGGTVGRTGQALVGWAYRGSLWLQDTTTSTCNSDIDGGAKGDSISRTQA